MKIYDLSPEISENMAVYKNRVEKRPKITVTRTIQEGANESKLDIYVHTGSHVDAPYHILNNGKTIEKVTLRMYQRSVSGTPYAGSNSLVVDHIDYSNSLEGADYDKSPIASNIGTLTSNAAVEWKDLDITSRFNNDLTNSRSRSQYRIKFSTETDGDGSEDFVYFDSANSGYNTNTPQLVVKYH